MGRYRSRSHSPRRSRSPPRRKRYDDARDSRSRRHRRSPAPSGLLVRNIALDARPEDLRVPFERFGPIKDVYLPKDYYSGEPRGFGFVKFRYAEDAAEAKQRLNYSIIGGREIRIVFAEENRKTPQEMRRSTRPSGQGSYRRQSPLRSPRHHYRSYSRSPSPARGDLRDRKARDDYYSPRRLRSISRSISPHVERNYLTNPKKLSDSVSEPLSPLDERNRRSNPKSPTPGENDRRPHDERDYAPSRSQSPKRNTRGLSRSRSRSRS